MPQEAQRKGEKGRHKVKTIGNFNSPLGKIASRDKKT